MPRGSTTTKLCDKCNEHISLFAFNRHLNACNGNGKQKHNKRIVPENLTCQFCSKISNTKLGWIKHNDSCKLNPDKSHMWLSANRHKVKKSNQFIKARENGTEYVVTNSTKEKLSNSLIGKKFSNSRKENLSRAMKEAVKNNPESYTSSNRGRTKQIEKYGVKFQGSWELMYYEFCLEHNIKIERCSEWFPYEWNGSRKYNPDFYLPETNTYVEVKGYETDRDRAKWTNFPNRLIVIRNKEIKQIKNKTFDLIELLNT